MKRELAIHVLLGVGLIVCDVVTAVIGAYNIVGVLLVLLGVWVYRGHMYHVTPLYVAACVVQIPALWGEDKELDEFADGVLQDFEGDLEGRPYDERVRVVGMINYIMISEMAISVILLFIFAVGRKL